MTSAQTRKFSSTINLGFFSIRPENRFLKAPRNFARTCIPLSRRKECALEIFLKNLPRKCSVYDLPAIDAESFFEFFKTLGREKTENTTGGKRTSQADSLHLTQ